MSIAPPASHAVENFKIYLFIEIISSFLLWLAAFSKVLPSDAAQTSCPAILHLHEALVGVGHVVGATNGVVLAGTDPAAAREHEFEVLQALRNGGLVDVLSV